MDQNFATLAEAVADNIGDEPALIHGDRRISWREFDDRAARLAACMTSLAVEPGAKVAQYLYNRPEYLESMYASFKVRAAPVNVNYRYLHDELAYLLENADAEVLFFSGSLGERVAEVRDRLPLLRAVIQVDDGSRLVDGALAYEDVIAAHDPAPRVERSGDDLLLLYTGGTTGIPKGVMWRCADLLGRAVFNVFELLEMEPPASIAEIAGHAADFRARGIGPIQVPASPLMHGAGFGSALGSLMLGGTVVTLPSAKFDADELWRAVASERVTQINIVGDPFARLMVEALVGAEVAGAAYDLSSLKHLHSTGAMFSDQYKQALLQRADITIVDALASSEALAMGRKQIKRGGDTTTARFGMGPHAAVLADDGREVEPGSGEIGVLAVKAPIPVGYYKDPEKTARTFREVGGTRYSIPGDFATVEADGSIALLGRGSVCINTGGEKVFPEEVEEVVKAQPGVADCLVVGVPDERYGEVVVAVASPRTGGAVDGPVVVAAVRERLASYKCPRHVVAVDAVKRAPNGKADYAWAKQVAASAMNATATR